MVPQWIIEKKRDGRPLTRDDIEFFISGFTSGKIPDYQMSALAMAIYFQGMTPTELSDLTNAMMNSGKVMDLSSIKGFKADKHSTGGIGDKVSIILAPLAASCGVPVPMISGRGLGITGGTLDKLESIPGYRTGLSAAEFKRVLKKCGCSMIGQTADLAPADKKLYALRDVTGTVPSIPLISASIMSKKLAEGADGLVLDVKFGSGAFMKDLKSARELAHTMVGIGKRMKKKMSALLTDMNQPLGRTAGNSLEIKECIECLRGNGPADLMLITHELTARMLVMAGVAKDTKSAIRMQEDRIKSGKAFANFKKMVQLHGGSVKHIDNPALLPNAAIIKPLKAKRTGYATEVSAELIGRACLVLGAGRQAVTDKIDHAVGVSGIVKVGEKIAQGKPLMFVHANSEKRLKESLALLEQAVIISVNPVRKLKLIREEIVM